MTELVRAEPTVLQRQDGPQDALLEILKDPERLKDFPIETVERLFKLSREMAMDIAKREFADAFNLVQAEMSPVARRGYNGHTKSHYPRLEDVAAMLDPIINAHGFSRSLSTIECPIQNHLRIVLTLRHIGGHRETHQLDAPIDTVGPKGSGNKTPLHGSASTMSYCERQLLLKVFGVQTSKDDDGNAGAGVGPSHARITEDQANDVHNLLEEVNADKGRFLDVFGVKAVEDLAVNQLRPATAMLEAKRRRVR